MKKSEAGRAFCVSRSSAKHYAKGAPLRRGRLRVRNPYSMRRQGGSLRPMCKSARSPSSDTGR
jgi:hypothetical protein